ncbi:MAG: potassium transporter TrkG [bacterium]
MNLRAVTRLVGTLLLLLGASMLLSVGVALIYKDGDAGGILVSAVIVMATGALMMLGQRGKVDLNLRDGFVVVSFGWFFMSLAGSIPFMITGAIPAFTDAFFESASGFTTTGASILTNIEGLPHGVLFWRSFTHWVGGMGIIVFSIAILPFLGIGGMQMFRAESPGPTADKLTPRIQNTAEILWGVYLLFTFAETVLLTLGGMPLFDSACHSFGTLATGGFSTKNASIGYYDSAYIHWVIIVFMFLAGVSFNLHYHALRGKPKKYIESSEFRFFALIILAAIAAMTALRLIEGDPFEKSLRESAFTAVSITTTTGYTTANFELWHPVAQIALVLLMFMGGMAGSTGGGMKAIRIQLLLKQARVELHKLVHPQTLYPIRQGRRIIQDDIIWNVLAFALLYAVLLATGTLLMSLIRLDHVTAFTSVVACLSNIGPGLGGVGPTDNYAAIPGFGKWVLSTMMIIGRLEIYTVLVLFTRTFWN